MKKMVKICCSTIRLQMCSCTYISDFFNKSINVYFPWHAVLSCTNSLKMYQLQLYGSLFWCFAVLCLSFCCAISSARSSNWLRLINVNSQWWYVLLFFDCNKLANTPKIMAQNGMIFDGLIESVFHHENCYVQYVSKCVNWRQHNYVPR